MVVKDLSASADKFKQRAGAAQGDYTKGVQGAGARWKAGVEASSERWAQGTQDAISRGAFAKGVSKTGADYYTQRAVKLGGSRYAQGVGEGAGNWVEGFKPFADVLAGLDAGPKGPKGDPRNQQRSIAVQIALRNRKTSAA